MSAYIEKEKEGTFLNPASCTVEVNPCKCHSDDEGTIDPAIGDTVSQNIKRWRWLIDGWETMTFKEKLALFAPYLHYVNLRDFYKPDFDDALNQEISETSYKLCRKFKDFKFDPDHQGIPNIVMTFEPINISQIPDTSIKSSVRIFADKYCLI